MPARPPASYTAQRVRKDTAEQAIVHVATLNLFCDHKLFRFCTRDIKVMSMYNRFTYGEEWVQISM
jgi:hypothetical protein